MNEKTTILPLRIDRKLRDKFSKICAKRTKESGQKSSMNYELNKFIVSEVNKK